MRLRDARAASQKTQEELAAALNIAQHQYSAYETGKTEPSGYLIREMARELGVTTDYLFGLVESPNDHLGFDQLSPQEQRLILAYRAHNTNAAINIIADSIKPGK